MAPISASKTSSRMCSFSFQRLSMPFSSMRMSSCSPSLLAIVASVLPRTILVRALVRKPGSPELCRSKRYRVTTKPSTLSPMNSRLS